MALARDRPRHRLEIRRFQRDSACGSGNSWPMVISSERDSARFREATGSSEASLIGPKRAVLVLADAGEGAPPILGPAIRHDRRSPGRIEAERQITSRYRQLDLGLAITAHEIRGPLLGARAALESVRADDVWSEADIDSALADPAGTGRAGRHGGRTLALGLDCAQSARADARPGAAGPISGERDWGSAMRTECR